MLHCLSLRLCRNSSYLLEKSMYYTISRAFIGIPGIMYCIVFPIPYTAPHSVCLGYQTKTNSYSSTAPRSQGSSNSSEGDILNSGVHLTILRMKSRKTFLLETSRFLSESSQDTDRTGFRHFQLPVVCVFGWRMHILGIKYLPLSSK